MSDDKIMISGFSDDKKKESAGRGDVYLYPRPDKDGSIARAGKHTNDGYSGYFLASIFDGEKWRRFSINKMIDYEERYFPYAKVRPEVLASLSALIRSWEGLTAVKTSSGFVIPDKLM